MLKSTLRVSASLALCFVGATIVACASHNTSGDSSTDDGNEAAASSAQSSHLGDIVISSVSSQDPTAAAASVSLGSGQLWPAGCATRAKDATNPRVVHVTFNECTGPFGMRHLSGEVTVTFSQNADGSLHAEHVGNGLTVNGHPVQFSASADITVNGAERDVKWHGAWTRTNDAGDTVAHTSDLQIKIDTAAHCRDSNGTAVTNVGAREVDSTISDYKLCRNPDGSESCPSGTITHHHKLSNKTVTVSFDGSAQATITGPNGGTVKVPLVCGA